VAGLEIAGNFLFDTATHRDFWRDTGTGIVRDKTGDIIVLGERGASNRRARVGGISGDESQQVRFSASQNSELA